MRRRRFIQQLATVAASPAVVVGGPQAVIAAIPRDLGRDTILGVHNPDGLSTSIVQSLGAKAVRLVIDVPTLHDSSTFEKRLQDLMQWKANFIVVATFTDWPGTKGGSITDPEAAENIGVFATFAAAAAAFIDICSIENEALVDIAPSDFEPCGDPFDHPSPAIQFYGSVAAKARTVFSSASTSQTRISAPALTGVPAVAQNPAGNCHFIDLLRWAAVNRNIDLLDSHLHVSNLSDIEASLNFLADPSQWGGSQSKQWITTEWSQAGAVSDWLVALVDPCFASTFGVDSSMTNQAFVDLCYGQAAPELMWDAFIVTAPYDPDFMRSAFLRMRAHQWVLATYGGASQTGNDKYDTKQLYATLTATGTDPVPVENDQFALWFRNIPSIEARNRPKWPRLRCSSSSIA